MKGMPLKNFRAIKKITGKIKLMIRYFFASINASYPLKSIQRKCLFTRQKEIGWQVCLRKQHSLPNNQHSPSNHYTNRLIKAASTDRIADGLNGIDNNNGKKNTNQITEKCVCVCVGGGYSKSKAPHFFYQKNVH